MKVLVGLIHVPPDGSAVTRAHFVQALLVVNVKIATVGGESGGDALTMVTVRVRPRRRVPLLMFQTVIVVRIRQSCDEVSNHARSGEWDTDKFTIHAGDKGPTHRI